MAAALDDRCVRSRHIELFRGLRLAEEEGWEVLLGGIERTCRLLARDVAAGGRGQG